MRTICSRLLFGAAGGGEGDHIVHDLGGICGVVDEGLGADGNFVAEDGGHFVGVAGAADVAQQRDPVDGVAHWLFESGGIADPRGEQAGAEL